MVRGAGAASVAPADLVAQIRYKPGWAFKVGGPLGQFLCVFATCPDSNNPARERTTQHMWPLPDATGPDFFRWVFERLLLAELHEAGEFFSVDGFRPHMPHHQDEGDPYELVDRWEPT